MYVHVFTGSVFFWRILTDTEVINIHKEYYKLSFNICIYMQFIIVMQVSYKLLHITSSNMMWISFLYKTGGSHSSLLVPPASSVSSVNF